MTLDEAKVILGDAIDADGNLKTLDQYTSWDKDHPDTVSLDGYFTADQLEAIVIYMRETK